MGHYTLKFLVIKHLENSFSGCHRGMLRVSACCEGIGAHTRNDIDLRHWKHSLHCQLVCDPVKPWRLGLRDLSCAVHLQDNLVREPVADKIHNPCHYKGHHHTAVPANCLPNEQEKEGKAGQKKCRF